MPPHRPPFLAYHRRFGFPLFDAPGITHGRADAKAPHRTHCLPRLPYPPHLPTPAVAAACCYTTPTTATGRLTLACVLTGALLFRRRCLHSRLNVPYRNRADVGRRGPTVPRGLLPTTHPYPCPHTSGTPHPPGGFFHPTPTPPAPPPPPTHHTHTTRCLWWDDTYLFAHATRLSPYTLRTCAGRAPGLCRFAHKQYHSACRLPHAIR